MKSKYRYIDVPVREDVYVEVLVLLADALAERENVEIVVDEEISAEEYWTVAELTRFAGVRNRSLETMQRVMDLLAVSPGTSMTTTELAAALGIGRDRLKGATSGLSRHLNSRFDGAPWPIQYEWTGTEQAYWMTEEMADKWIEVRETGTT